MNLRLVVALAAGLVLISACVTASASPTPGLPAPAGSEQPSLTAPPNPTSTLDVSPTPTAATGSIDVQPAEGLAFFDTRHGLMVGTDGAGRGLVWRTADGGRTWTQPVAVAPGPLESVTVVGTSAAWALQACPGGDPSCPSTVWASSDGGSTWHRLGSVPAYALSFADPRQGWAVAGGPVASQVDVSLLRTTDGGRTWQGVADPCRPSFGWAAAVSFADQEHGWIGCLGLGGAGETPKAILATADGGRTWSLRSAVLLPGRADVGTIPMDDDLAGLAMRPDGIGLAWGSRGLTMRTTDGGRTWRSMPPGEWDVVDPSSGWATSDTAWTLLLWDGGRGRQIVETTADGGRSWALVALMSPVHSTG